MESWLNWWELNRDHLLAVERRYRQRSSAVERSSDIFLGDGGGDVPASPVVGGSADVRRRVMPVIKKLLGHDNHLVRAEAAMALGRTGRPADLGFLFALAKDDVATVRQAAIMGMGLLQSNRANALLSHTLRNVQVQNLERAFAAMALGIIGDESATDVLIETATPSATPAIVRAASLYSLGFLKTSRTRVFLEYFSLNVRNPGRMRAVAAQGISRDGAPEALEVLLRLADDGEVHVRRSVAIGLGELVFESSYRPELDELEEGIGKLSDDSPESGRALSEIEDYRGLLRVKVAADERRLSAMQSEAIGALMKRVEHDSDVMVRNFALIALGEIASEEATRALERYFSTLKSSSMRAFAVLALGIKQRDEEVAEVVHRRLRSGRMDNLNKAAMILALGLMDRGRAANTIAHHMKKRGDGVLTGHAALALGLLNEDAYKAFMRAVLLSKSRSELKPAFGTALALLGDHRSVDGLGRMLTGRSPVNTKLQAAAALAAVNDIRTLDVLLKATSGKQIKDLPLAATVRAIGIVAERGEEPILSPYFRHLNYLVEVGPMNSMAFL